MKKLFKLLAIICLTTPVVAQNNTPVYLDSSKPIEQRIEDALQRMTLEEKVKLCHA